jgi:4-amino-4-deoxy-L-arabinose transferase-like glycosyltransferase
MSRALFTPRELAIWAACFLVAAALIVLTGFTSLDADSALYAGISGKLTQEPFARWIAPEWWGFWDGTGLFREHPAGLFFLPAAMGRLGISAIQAAFVQGIAAALGSLLLIGVLVARVTRASEGRAALILLQLMPVAFIFRIRSNHEYPMLFCLALTLVALDNVRRSWWWAVVVALAVSAAMLVKGVFVVLILIAAGLWTMLNPTQQQGSPARPLLAIVAGLVAMLLVALAYDAWYLNATGETFWDPYWRRQMGPVTVASPLTGAATALHHLGFYVLRILWHPAPWSFAVLALAWRYRRRFITQARTLLAASEQRAIVFAGLFILAVIGLLFPLSRWAERYAFSATYTAAALGAVIACRTWAPIRALDRFWTTSSTSAALLWLALIVLRLIFGPLLPRLQ